MKTKTAAKLTSKGQITIPASVRKKWGLKAGDMISFDDVTPDKGTIRPKRRRSIFEAMKEWKQPVVSKPLTQEDIDKAIGDEIHEKFLRVMAQNKS